jgi:transcriptional regulator with XRE-family HTH domain
MSTTERLAGQARRRELGAFLRSRRERLHPLEVGLPGIGRRRTPGLRREEVALLSGVSTTWYTYLEQGRDIRCSVQVVEALARALRLDDTERTHLHLLALDRLPAPFRPATEALDPSMPALLAALEPHPAYVTGRTWNLLAMNAPAATLFDGFTDLPADRRNVVWWVFTHPGAKRTLVEWPQEARRLLARFRAAAARYPDDPAFTELRDALLAASEQARAWWPDQQVLPRTEGHKLLRLGPAGTPQVLRHLVLQPQTTPDQKLVVYLPLPPVPDPTGQSGGG